MKRFVAIIVGLHVLAHSIFGCCDHVFAAFKESVGGHACSHGVAKQEEAGRHEDSDRDAAATHNDEFEKLRATASADRHSVPHGRHDCRHDSCHWLTSDGLPNIDLLDSHFDAMYVPITCAAVASTPTFDFWPETDVGRNHALALRLHLALGVLQI